MRLFAGKHITLCEATVEEAEKVVGQTIVTTDGHQVNKEGWHGSMIIQQEGGIQHTNNSGMDIITVYLTKVRGV